MTIPNHIITAVLSFVSITYTFILNLLPLIKKKKELPENCGCPETERANNTTPSNPTEEP
jgi:hypothetical protein